MDRIKCKQSTSFYALWCIYKQEQAGVHSLTLYTHFIESKAILLSPICKITLDLIIALMLIN